MSMLTITPQAQQDIDQAYRWYEEQGGVVLADRFLNAVEVQVTDIAERPRSFPAIYREVRRSLCARFPYAVYFFQAPTLKIIGVLHTSRSPRAWKSRPR